MLAKNKIIARCNSLLIKHFGIPKRKKHLPNHLDTLIATILSQNTNDNNSYKAYQNLRNRFSNWDELLLVKKAKLENLIRVAGLSEQKSKAIKNLVRELNNRGVVDLSFIKKLNNEDAIDELTQFDGIGIKTASCVLLFAFDRDVCPVDTHVHRTLNRIGIVNETTPDKTYFSLNKNFPEVIAHSFHTNLIRLGREICKPQKPKCVICPLQKICNYEHKYFSADQSSKQNSFMLLDNL